MEYGMIIIGMTSEQWLRAWLVFVPKVSSVARFTFLCGKDGSCQPDLVKIIYQYLNV